MAQTSADEDTDEFDVVGHYMGIEAIVASSYAWTWAYLIQALLYISSSYIGIPS